MRLPVCPRTTIEELLEVEGERKSGVDSDSTVSGGAGREGGVGLRTEDKHAVKKR